MSLQLRGGLECCQGSLLDPQRWRSLNGRSDYSGERRERLPPSAVIKHVTPCSHTFSLFVWGADAKVLAALRMRPRPSRAPQCPQAGAGGGDGLLSRGINPQHPPPPLHAPPRQRLRGSSGSNQHAVCLRGGVAELSFQDQIATFSQIISMRNS